MRAAGMPRKQHDRARLGIAGLTIKALNARNLGRTVADLCVVPRHVQTPFLRCLVRADEGDRRAPGHQEPLARRQMASWGSALCGAGHCVFCAPGVMCSYPRAELLGERRPRHPEVPAGPWSYRLRTDLTQRRWWTSPVLVDS